MPRRPWRNYHQIKGHPWVKRWKKTDKGRREYVSGVPDSKIRMFSIGTKKDYEYELFLIAKERAQVSHLSLEAARVAGNRHLREALGREDYFMRILVYPHHVVREHRMMAFAGADRLQDGMRKAFGKPFGTAARVYEDQKLISIKIDKKNLAVAQRALKVAKMKFPIPSRIEIVELKKHEDTPPAEEDQATS